MILSLSTAILSSSHVRSMTLSVADDVDANSDAPCRTDLPLLVEATGVCEIGVCEIRGDLSKTEAGIQTNSLVLELPALS